MYFTLGVSAATAAGCAALVRAAQDADPRVMPQADPHAAWALATLAALMSGDWLNAREPVSRGRTASRPARSTARPRRA